MKAASNGVEDEAWRSVRLYKDGICITRNGDYGTFCTGSTWFICPGLKRFAAFTLAGVHKHKCGPVQSSTPLNNWMGICRSLGSGSRFGFGFGVLHLWVCCSWFGVRFGLLVLSCAVRFLEMISCISLGYTGTSLSPFPSSSLPRLCVFLRLL